MNEWIPVATALPPEDSQVLVVYFDAPAHDEAFAKLLAVDHPMLGPFVDIGEYSEGAWIDRDWQPLDRVTHWMPLPEPPPTVEPFLAIAPETAIPTGTVSGPLLKSEG